MFGWTGSVRSALREKEISLLTRNHARAIIHLLSQLDSQLSPHTRLPGRISIQVIIAQGNRGESARHEFRPATISAP